MGVDEQGVCAEKKNKCSQEDGCVSACRFVHSGRKVSKKIAEKRKKTPRNY